ncbi:lipid A deacylase LpxR family protein [uncultured Hyphomonas sp.]|uniref:lipid A deacylase LpxR family protein n=1 Tax=uncultured Hyphomonas sp. TaxID=225298 RepID=UPI000C4EABFB|nr:hypothetical protein [Hyphomonadaceae bacterium]MBA29751.1 hypothetical protein [Hyphomonadaceae bacterium]|tara:strand:- start:2673 stop:3788 length:1116 start_codon:yes stop_codon:yes gene_type:complete
MQIQFYITGAAMRVNWTIGLVSILCMILSETAAAQDSDAYREEKALGADLARQGETQRESRNSQDRSVISLVSENDLFGGSDRNYTNGLRIERFAPASKARPWLRWAADVVPFVDVDQVQIRSGLGLSHAIFTPKDIEAPIPDPNDRPYAGWLYVSSTAVALANNRLDQHSLQLNLGVVGPSAGGAFVQTHWHELIDGKNPNGWDYQLHDELGVEIIAERLRRIRKSRLGPFEIDSAVFGGVTLGNVHTHASAGGMVRLGFDLDSDFGPPRIRPSIGGAGTFNPNDDFGGYLFWGAEGRYVVRNIFLDGNTFDENGPRVTARRRWVGDIQTGIAINIKSTQIAFTYVHRTEQFQAQDGADKFGAVSISVVY